MPLKNKDGTPYRLKRPNPLMFDQQSWNPDDLDLHNLDTSAPNLIEPGQKKIEKKEIAPMEPVNFMAEINKEPEMKLPEPKPRSEPIVPDYKLPKFHSLLIYCVPAKIVSKEDMYGEVQRTIAYDSKIEFTGDYVQKSDLGVVIKTNVDIPESSVIFPHKHTDGSKLSEFRWWKVTSCKLEQGNYILNCIISDYQPYF